MAQRYFDQGLRLAYAFNHAEAHRAFKKAQELDPDCAMCFWGEAFVLGANINAAMEEGAVQPAFLAMTNAKARAANASEREQALIDALAKRYAADPAADQAALAQAYADAMAAAHARYPDDQDDRGAVRRCADEHLALGLLGGGRPHAQGAAGRSGRGDRGRARGQSRPPGRDPPVHPPDRGLGRRPRGRSRTPTGSPR